MSILGFKGPYRFLSNFWMLNVPIIFEGAEYSSVEHAYQASKFEASGARKKIRLASSAAEAKRIAWQYEPSPGFNQKRLDLMENFVTQKFTLNSDLRQLLLQTGNAYIEETNTWGDTFWGVCDEVGENHLGRIIMQLRDRLRSS